MTLSPRQQTLLPRGPRANTDSEHRRHPSPSPSSRFSLAGKVAIVTGASRGIGEAIARELAGAGAQVVVASRKIDGVTAVAEAIGDLAHPVAAHTGKEADCNHLVEAAVARFGKVDVLVNNAATNPYFGPLLGIDEGAWDKTFEVNLKGYFWMIRGVVNHLTSRGAPGSIVNVASVAETQGRPRSRGFTPPPEAAVISMTKTLAYELAPSGIRVNAICPGLIDTKFASAIVKNEDLVLNEVTKKDAPRQIRTSEVAGGAL